MKKTTSLRQKFLELAKLDPRLLDLERLSIQTAEAHRPQHRLDAFYLLVKPQVCRLAGWDRRGGPETLRTDVSYDIAYQHCVQLMDDTRYRSQVARALHG